jgi:hypothetical protein
MKHCPPCKFLKKKHFGIKELPVLVFGKKKKKDKLFKKNQNQRILNFNFSIFFSKSKEITCFHNFKNLKKSEYWFQWMDGRTSLAVL